MLFEGCGGLLQRVAIPFGIGLGETSDSVDTAGAIFDSFGAELVDVNGNLTVKTDAVLPGTRVLQEADRLSAAGCASMGQRFKQQMADRR